MHKLCLTLDYYCWHKTKETWPWVLTFWSPKRSEFLQKITHRFKLLKETWRKPNILQVKVWYGTFSFLQATSSLPTDILWGSFVTHSFPPECVTNELQRTSAGRLGHLLFVFLILLRQDGHETRDWMIGCYAIGRARSLKAFPPFFLLLFRAPPSLLTLPLTNIFKPLHS